MIAYLLASLPTPRRTEPPAIELGTFVERCRGFVSEERWRDLEALLDPGAGSEVGVGTTTTGRAARADERRDRGYDHAASAWRDLSAQIDDAVAIQRGASARRDPAPYLQRPTGYRVDVVDAVEHAFATQHPGTRERVLDELRWRLADELAAREPDGFAALYARAVQLRLAWRWSRWDTEAGWTALEASLRELEAPHA